MDAENGFLIAGKVYEVPTLDSLTLDEAKLLWDQAEITVADFVQEEGATDEEHRARVAQLMKPPGFMAALALIAYQRGNPTLKPSQVMTVLGKTNSIELLSSLSSESEEEPADVPLALTSEHSESSESGSQGTGSTDVPSSGTSGSDSQNGSEDSAGEVVSIGTTRSAISSTSAPSTSAAQQSGI